MKRQLMLGRKEDILSYMTPRVSPDPTEVVRHALRYRTQTDLASILGVSPRTIRRWVVGEAKPKSGFVTAINHELARDNRPQNPDFTFVDLFAGIGGLRQGFEPLNGRCVFTSEWDPHACKTYKANFPDAEDINGDIKLINPGSVPDHDVLLAGFPCQPFSLAGVTKKKSLGRAHGFRDVTQGTLFFNVVRILEAKQPRAFLLENVKNLRGHDGGNTYRIIRGALEELGYTVFDGTIDSSPWVPQRRERIFIAGFKVPVGFSFGEMKVPHKGPSLGRILHSEDEVPEAPYTVLKRGKTVVDERYTLSDHLWKYLQGYAAKHKALGNGFGCSVFTKEDIARTLSARYHKDGSEILIAQRGRNPRRLTPRECARLMGFDQPGKPPFIIPDSVSDTQAYRQFGNSVVVPVVEEIARMMMPRVLAPQVYPPRSNEQLELLQTGTDGARRNK
jgi:DNA (cytosine-5)-methyltransferase 1